MAARSAAIHLFDFVLTQSTAAIAKKELATTTQTPRNLWRRDPPPLDSWVLYPKQNLLCYIKYDRLNLKCSKCYPFVVIL
jgi:hypothetical protein